MLAWIRLELQVSNKLNDGEGKGFEMRKIRMASLILTVSVIIIVFPFIVFADNKSQTAPPSASYHYISITVTNTQPFMILPNFDIQITFNAQQYTEYENTYDLGNIRFYSSSGATLCSWLESGGPMYYMPATAIFWVKMDQPIPAKSTVTLQMRFLKIGTEFDGKYAGEAPYLTPTYGQFDNGSNVFYNYANFIGNSLPSGWNIINGNGISINNGLTFTPNGSWATIGTNWTINFPYQYSIPLYTEAYIYIEHSGGAIQNEIFASSQLPNNSSLTGNVVGFQSGSGLEVESNYGGNPQVVASATPTAKTFPAVVGIYENKLYYNYNCVLTMQNNILNNGYLCVQSWAPAVVQNIIVYYWFRQRIAPPNNIMPEISLSSIM